MDILMVAAELSPYARVTRAGDTVAALGKTLIQLGHDVTVALPRYPGFEAGGLLVARRLTPLDLGEGREVAVLDGQLATGVKIVLFDSPESFDRGGIWAEEDGQEYSDNGRRYALLCRAAGALVEQRAELGQPFDIVHLHDWAAAPVALVLQQMTARPACVLTVHDARRFGAYTPEELSALGLVEERLEHARLGDRISFLKAGVVGADAITTVSPTYATDLGKAEVSGEMAESFQRRAAQTVGILNGLDFSIYNPASDAGLKARFDAEDVSNKGISKTECLRRHGLELELGRPLVVALVDGQSGAELLDRALGALLKNDVSLVIASLDPGARESTPAAPSERLARVGRIDDGELRRLCAAADLALVPASYDRDAFLARAAQRYGAVPVGRAAGGHREVVVDCDSALETGTGFVWEHQSAEAVVGAVQRGLAAFVSERWPDLRRRVMRLDLGWDRPGRRYLQVYRQAMREQSGRE